MPGLQARQTDAGIMQPTGVRALLVVAATVFILSAAGCTGARMPHQATTRSSVSPSPATTSSVCECCRPRPTARTRTGAAAARARRSALAHDRRVRHGGSGSWPPMAAAVEPRGAPFLVIIRPAQKVCTADLRAYAVVMRQSAPVFAPSASATITSITVGYFRPGVRLPLVLRQ